MFKNWTQKWVETFVLSWHLSFNWWPEPRKRCVDKKLDRGKIQVYYVITEKGLKALLYYDDFDPIRFWEILYAYCQHSDEIVTLDKIEEFYQIVIRRYLKHSVHEFSCQLDFFDDICNNWFQKTIVMSNGITPLKKLLRY